MTNPTEQALERQGSAAESPARKKAKDALLDAALKLLIDVGYAKLTTRELAAASGVNQGLIHYYFGSLEEVLFQALERYSDALIERQRAMYEGPEPFIVKWRTAMSFLEQDLAAGYPKVAFELSALGWNHPRFRARAAAILDQFRALIREALRQALPEYGLDEKRFPLEGVVSLVVTSQLGYMFEWLGGIHDGHRELLAMFDGWLEELSRTPTRTPTRTQTQMQKRTQGRTPKQTKKKKPGAKSKGEKR